MNKRRIIAALVSLAVILSVCVFYWVKQAQPISYRQPLRSFIYAGQYGNGVSVFAPNDHILAILTQPKGEPEAYDFTAAMVNVDTGNTRWRFPHVGPYGSFSADGSSFYSLGKYGLVRCDMSSGKEQMIVKVQGETPRFSTGFRSVLIAEKNSLALYNMRSGQLIRRYPAPDELCGIALSPDARTIAMASAHQIGVSVYDAATGEKIVQLKTPSGSEIAFSRDSTQLVTASDHQPVTVWETRHWKQVANLPVENYTQVWEIYFVGDKKLVVGGQIEPARHNINELWDLASQRRLIETQGADFVINGNGPRVAALDVKIQESLLTVFNVKSGKELFRYYPSHSPAFHPCFSSDGTLLAECSNDDPATVEVWRVPR